MRLPVGRGLVVEYSNVIRGNEYWLHEGWHRLNLKTDISSFLDICSPLEKKKYFHTLIEDAFQRLDGFLDEKVPMQKILQILNDMEKDNYENVWQWSGGRKFSPSRKLFTQITVAHEIDHFKVVFKVLNKNSESVYDNVIQIDSSQEPILDDVLGQLKWLDEKHISILPKSKYRKEMLFSGW